MKHSSKLFVFVLAAVLLLMSANGFAASPWTDKTTYHDKLVGKLDFGFKNLFAGWTEIFTEPIDAHKAGTNPIRGLAVGIANAIVDTVGGALHLVTFPVTQVDVPLPQNGVSL